MIEFRSLASSSAGCCYKLSAEGYAPLLIECGIPFRKIQEALDFKTSHLAGCLVSHAHQDHCKAWRELRAHSVQLYASKETWFQLGGSNGFALEPLKRYAWGGWGVTAFEAVHDLPGTLGFVIDGAESRCLYLTDSAYSPFRFEGLTHIFIECNHSSELMRQSVRRGMDPVRYARTARNHMSLERLIQFLAANDLSQVREIHLLHLSDANSDERAFKEAVQRASGCPVYVAEKTAA